MKKKLQQLHRFILDTLFPVQCLSCRQEGHWICSQCFQQIPLRQQQVCPYCQTHITPNGETCLACQRKYRLDGILVAGNYSSSLLQLAIHTYKYRFIDDLHQELGRFLIKALHRKELPLPDLIIPIPLHPYRQRWRGFNQSYLLAEFLAKNLLPHYTLSVSDKILLRKQLNVPQMSISHQQQRQKNIQGVFQINPVAPSKVLLKKKIWLIDDVTTTGATLNEAGKILKQNGAEKVFAIVLARQGASNL